MRRTRMIYSNGFKELMVQLHLLGKPFSEIVSEYDLTTSVFYRWISQYKNSGTCSKKNNPNKEKNELIHLHKELNQLRAENDILRQAAIIIGRKQLCLLV